MALGCAVARLNGLGQYGGNYGAYATNANYGAYLQTTAATTPNETVTVTACGYGSAVVGYPTIQQYMHKSLCELGNLLNSSLHLRFSEIWQNAFSFMQSVFHGALGGVGDIFRPAWDAAKNVVAPVAKAIADTANALFDSLSKALGQVARGGFILAAVAVGAVAFYFAAKTDPNRR